MGFDASGFLFDLHGGPAADPPEGPAATIPTGPEAGAGARQLPLDLDPPREPRIGDRVDLGEHGTWVRIPGGWQREGLTPQQSYIAARAAELTADPPENRAPEACARAMEGPTPTPNTSGTGGP